MDDKAKIDEKNYTEAELNQLFRDAGKRGAVLALLHFDAYGRDKEVIRQAIVEMVSSVTREPGVIYAKGEVEEVREGKDKDGNTEFSTYTEVKVLFASLSRALSLCLKYAPVAVEILEPAELKLNAEEIQNIMLDASSISQQYTNFYMKKLLSKEELADFQDHLKKRAEEGRRLLEKAGDPKKEETLKPEEKK
ncbi:MAG: hypothetical protein V1787_00650 [Candidatus Micrarchaeota archaeon]